MASSSKIQRKPGRSEIWQRPEINQAIRKECLRLGARLREIRLSLGATQEEAAEAIGIHPIYLQRMEGGKTNVSVGILKAISIAYGVPIPQLFESGPIPNPFRQAPAAKLAKGKKKRRQRR
ncbi:MAG: helix-turn-helix transcriptional regulator [Bdellovibrionota bacterium]